MILSDKRRLGGRLAAALFLVGVGNFTLSVATASPDPSDPRALVESITARVLTTIESEAAVNQPARLYRSLEQLLTPHTDFEHISRWAIGRYWKTFDKLQRERFRAAFRPMLIRTAVAAIGNPSKLDVTYAPVRLGHDGNRAVVQTFLSHPGSRTIQVDYRLARSDDRWLVRDLAIDGVSFVTTYRASFAVELRATGADALIERLEARNQDDEAVSIDRLHQSLSAVPSPSP